MATQGVSLGRAWDDQFQGWTDDLQLGRKLKKPAQAKRARSGWTGAAVLARTPQAYPSKGSKADVRARLASIARGGRQVMVKITPGKNRTMRAVREHLQYIGQDGEGIVRDQNGQAYQGEEAVAALAWAWQHGGPKMPEASEHRLAFNIMFSMPEGTDERAVYEAVKATAAIEFAGHQWVMGQHFDEPQVHCHVAVKAVGDDGVRLNPRKADLQRWRERFAHELRMRGVEAEATRRAARMHQPKINKPWAVTRLEERGLATNPAPAQGDSTRIKQWQMNQKQAASSYAQIIAVLHRSEDAADRMLARELERSRLGAQVKRETGRERIPEKGLERT